MAAVIDELTKTRYFTEHDFVIVSDGRKDRSIALKIQYRHEPRFAFTAVLPATFVRDGDIFVTAVPGSIAESEQAEVFGKEGLLLRVAQWVEHVRAELKALPTARELERERARIDALIAQVSKLPDEYFTKEEGDRLKARLDELEKRFVENVRTTTKGTGEAKLKIEQLRTEFDMLKATVDVLKKPGWAASFAARCGRWLRDPSNRALLKDGADVARKLLE